MSSPNNTVIGLANQSITDAAGNIWAIVNGQVAVNGVVDASTANVIEMAYENGIVWQKNADNLWWSKGSPTASWDPPHGTSTDPIPHLMESANDAVVRVVAGKPTASLRDASGNTWSVSQGQVTLNGVTDPTTANVIALAYVNGQIWQENSQHLWWSKTLPADPWGPEAGTSKSPLAGIVHKWNGDNGSFATAADWTPHTIPKAGQIAWIASGEVTVAPDEAASVNFVLKGGEVAFNAAGSFATGTWSGSGTVLVGYPGQKATVTATGVHMSGGDLFIRPFAGSSSSWTLLGDSSLTSGAVLDCQLIGTASLPRGTLENDGTMTVKGSTLVVGMLTGQGIVHATQDSTLVVIGASAGETIQLVSAHLTISGGLIQTSTAMQFLAPITQFGADSTISLDNTQATREVFVKSGPTAGELFLYNGATMVADLHIRGQAQIYAENIPASTQAGSVLLTAYDTGHSIPPT